MSSQEVGLKSLDEECEDRELDNPLGFRWNDEDDNWPTKSEKKERKERSNVVPDVSWR